MEMNIEIKGIEFRTVTTFEWDGTIEMIEVYIGDQELTDVLTQKTLDDIHTKVIESLPDGADTLDEDR